MTEAKKSGAVGSLETMQPILELVSRLRKSLIALGFRYMNAVLGGLGGERDRPLGHCMRLRDAAIFRAACLQYHVGLLVVTHDQLRDAAHQGAAGPLGDIRGHDFMIFAQEQELFLLEDVIANCVSLLEYIGNLTGFALYGEQRSAIKWKGVVSFARNEEKERRETGATFIAGSRAGKFFSELDSRLMRHLVDYRAKLFHYQREFAAVELRTPIFSDRGEGSTLTVKPPSRLTALFARKGDNATGAFEELPVWAARVAGETMSAVLEIVTALEADVSEKGSTLRQRVSWGKSGKRRTP
jgi:hypothetical protein